MKMRKRNSIIIQTIIGLILLALWIKYTNLATIIHYIKKVNFALLPLIFILYVSAYAIRSYRWKIILSPLKEVPSRRIFYMYMAGLFINYIIPVRAGEVAKSYFLRNEFSIPMSKSFPTVFVDKMFDLIGIVLVILIVPFINFEMGNWLFVLLGLILTIVVLFVFVIFLSIRKKEFVLRISKKVFSHASKKYEEKILGIIENFIDGMFVVKRKPYHLLVIFLLSIFAIFVDGTFCYFLFHALNYHVAFIIVFFGYTIMNLSYILPTAPGGVGTTEVIWSLIFVVGLGLISDKTASVIVFGHLFGGLIVIIIGLLSLSLIKFDIRNLMGKRD